MVGPSGIAFERVWPEWIDATPFSRISEYFTGKENTGGRIVLRTHPEVRSGLYFVVRVKNPGPPIPGAKFVLEIIAPGSPFPRVYAFPAGIPRGSKLCELGLTGSDWSNGKTHPLAWMLELRDRDGQALVQAQSFLWSKP